MDLINQMLIATKSSKIDISLEKNTELISKKFSNFIKRGDIIFFYGEIGVGKTTFIKYLINSLQTKKKLKLTIRNLKDSNQSINFYVEKNINQNTKFFNKKNAYILNEFFFDLSHEVIFRSLSFLMKLISGKYYVARGKSINGLIEKIQSNRINAKVTLGGCFIEKINKTILISREKSFKN